MKVLLDTNIVLDLLLKREPFCEDAKEIFERIETGKLQGYLCATTITTIHYLVSKNANKSKTNAIIKNLLSLFNIAEVSKDTLLAALESDGKDFEDSVIFTSANLSNLDAIVTRDLKGFANSPIDVYLPREFLSR